jgi:hypothetical protein
MAGSMVAGVSVALVLGAKEQRLRTTTISAAMLGSLSKLEASISEATSSALEQ